MSALLPKQQHLGHEEQAQDAAAATTAQDSVVEVDLINPHGLHARPAAAFVQAAATYDAQIKVTDVSTGSGPANGASMMAVLCLGADQGHRIRIEATGPQAGDATLGLRDLVATGFGET